MQWLTLDQACTRLGVKRQTLYAYVSRGRIGAIDDPAQPGRSLYRAADLEELIKSRGRGRKRQTIAASTMAWGEPSITTRISTIEGNRLYYRGQDAVRFSAEASLEQAAQLLWESAEPPLFLGQRPVAGDWPARTRANVVLAVLAGEGAPTYGLALRSLHREACSLVGHLAAAFVPALCQDDRPLHQRLSEAWGLDGPAADLVRRTLVLLADQELTSSAFAARVTASTGASLGAAALSGLATLSGPLHGDATVRVRALLTEARQHGALRALRRWLDSGLPVPGFGHPLYPEGDPRAAELLRLFDPAPETAALVATVQEITGHQPTIDVALAALVERLALPEEAAFTLFAVGRSIGWMAHAIEQIGEATLLRPRARYAGPPLRPEVG